MKNRLICILIMSVLCIFMLSICINASEVASAGNCTDSISWSLDADGVLTISGTGDMPDYADDESNRAPWYANNADILSIVIESGVTSIGKYAFFQCAETEVTIADSVNAIGEYAFAGCTFLTSVDLPDNLTAISNYTFQECTGLTEVVIPDSVTSIGVSAFGVCLNLTTITIPAAVTEIGDIAFLSCGKLSSVYFNGDVPSVFGADIFDNTSKSLCLYYYEGTTGWTEGTWTSPDGTEFNTVALENPNPPAATDSYTVALSASASEVIVGEEFTVTVTADKTFAAAELVLEYNKDMLTFVGVAPEINGKITNQNGKLSLADFGDEKTAYTITFKANTDGVAAIMLTSAAFSSAEDAASEDLTAAVISSAGVSVEIDMPDQTVTLPTDILSGNTTVAYGTDYTFTVTDNGEHYDYTVSATMGDDTATVISNGDGSYTVKNVTAALVITASRSPKEFDIKFSTNSGVALPAGGTITYGQAYSFTIPTRDGYATSISSVKYGSGGSVTYTIDNGAVTIAGDAITDHINVVIEQVRTEITVTLNGSAASDVENFNPSAAVGEDYVLTVNADDLYVYTVRITVDGTEITYSSDENIYTVDGINITSNAEKIVITVDKILNVASLSTTANEYLTLQGGSTLWLIRVDEKVDGKVYCYDGEEMFWSETYNAYCTVVESETTPVINAEKLTLVDDSAAVLSDSMDVNMSGKVDTNDAQFVYNLYNKMYDGISDAVTAEKYLRADTNGDGKIDVNDALKIVNRILNIEEATV